MLLLLVCGLEIERSYSATQYLTKKLDKLDVPRRGNKQRKQNDDAVEVKELKQEEEVSVKIYHSFTSSTPSGD